MYVVRFFTRSLTLRSQARNEIQRDIRIYRSCIVDNQIN